MRSFSTANDFFQGQGGFSLAINFENELLKNEFFSSSEQKNIQFQELILSAFE